METYRTKVTEGGRVVIPAAIRRQLGLEPGMEVVLDVSEGELRVRSVHRAIEQAQALIRRHVAPDANLSTELIAERRRSARIE